MTIDDYLHGVLFRNAVDTGPLSPLRGVQLVLQPLIQRWAGIYLRGVAPSGSFAKGTANRGSTDIDLFISLTPETPDTLQGVHSTLVQSLREVGHQPRLQNVSVSIRVNGASVDLVPAIRQNNLTEDHSLYVRKRGSWMKTNVFTHIGLVRASGRSSEIRLLKLWRDQRSLEFPSIYLELTVIEALRGFPQGALAQNMVRVFQYLAANFSHSRVIDPANTNNIISEDLTKAERASVSVAASRTLAMSDWTQVIS